jgi:exosortase/archaeosortase
MDKFIKFYTVHQDFFLNILFFLSILMCLLVGIVAMNTFNNKNEKDLTGKQLLVAMLFLSMVIYNSTAEWANRNFVYLTSLLLGYGSLDILKKWRKLKIWNKFDMIGKDGGKDD